MYSSGASNLVVVAIPGDEIANAILDGGLRPEADVAHEIADIGEGLNAGMWTVGVVEHGNEVGLTEKEFAALPESDKLQRLNIGRDRLEKAGAHYVVDRISEVPGIVQRIEDNMRQVNR